MREQHFDVIVAGIGSMGAAAAYYASCSGARVLGLEQFGIPHDQGSHAGQSRIIRKAYFEHPDYVPLLDRAYQNWNDLETACGTPLYHETGLTYLGQTGHPIMKGVRQAASKYHIQLRELSHHAIFPVFNIPDDHEMLYEPHAGFLQPEKAVQLYSTEAKRKGAVIHEFEPMLSFETDIKGVKVHTALATYTADKLILTGGPWMSKLLPALSPQLQVTRQIICWVKPAEPEHFLPHRFGCWLIAEPDRPGALYGFPYLDEPEYGEPRGLKFAWHHAGDPADPDQVNREVGDAELKDLIQRVGKYISAVQDATVTAAKTCLYTNTPDEHFIIDHLPGTKEKVSIACGFSGHGFKFASVVGEVLSDLALRGGTELPVDFLQLKRFGNIS